MVIKRRKKATKMRGTRTHGWGLVHRNSGQRGGAGNAGRGKKAHSNKPTNWLDKTNPRYFGKHGFKYKGTTEKDTPINIKEVEEKLTQWVNEKKAEQKGNAYEINLEKLGYTKLLSTGTATKKIKITVKTTTEKAKQKITKIGGEIITSEQKIEQSKKEPTKQTQTKVQKENNKK